MRPYHAYTPDQAFLFPPSFADLIVPDDPVHLVRQVVHDLDLTAIHKAYRSERGRPPFHPEAMVGLLLYGACRGIYSSRRLAQACRDNVAFMWDGSSPTSIRLPSSGAASGPSSTTSSARC